MALLRFQYANTRDVFNAGKGINSPRNGDLFFSTNSACMYTQYIKITLPPETFPDIISPKCFSAGRAPDLITGLRGGEMKERRGRGKRAGEGEKGEEGKGGKGEDRRGRTRQLEVWQHYWRCAFTTHHIISQPR